jgi:hypothetical protein
MGLERHGKRIWVNSLGGPLIVLEACLLPHWQGIQNGDYERACAIDGWFGTLPVADGFALVLADEPTMTTVVARPDGVVFARWHAADDIDAVDRLLDALGTSDVSRAQMATSSLTFADPSLVLFDFSQTGESLSRFDVFAWRSIDEGALKFSLSPGTFSLECQWLDPSGGMLSAIDLLRGKSP